VSLAPPKPTHALIPGKRLDRYELLCPIAEGGMGACWLARLRGEHGFEKLVVVKTLKAEYASDPLFQKMFLDEARIASGIQHLNVAQILDVGEEDGLLYMMMEFVDGDSVAKPAAPAAASKADNELPAEAPEPRGLRYRPWAELLRRTFALDVLACAKLDAAIAKNLRELGYDA
jgi:hypothetical protein